MVLIGDLHCVEGKEGMTRHLEFLLPPLGEAGEVSQVS